jgi:hypothetical protein
MSHFLCSLLLLLLPTLILAAPIRPPQGGTGTDITPAKGTVITSDGTKYFGDTPYASVKAFGAVGNGIANDTTVVQQAIDANDTFFPPGTYLVSNTLTVPSDRKLYGAKGATIKLADNTNLPLLRIGAVSNVIIEGLTLDGNQVNQPSCGGGCRGILSIVGSTGLIIRDTTIMNTRNEGIRLSGAINASIVNNRITDVLGETAQGAGINFVGPTSSQYVVVSGNHLARIGGAAIVYSLGTDAVVSHNVINDVGKTITQQAIILGYGDLNNTDTQRVVASHNVINGTTQHGCARLGGSDLTFEHNTLVNCNAAAANDYAVIASTSNTPGIRGRNLRILNNFIRLDTNTNNIIGIQMNTTDAGEISGNRLIMSTTSGANAVVVSDVTNTTVSNNRVEEGATCLRLLDVSQLTVVGNFCRGQTVKGIYLTSPVASNQVSIVGNTVTGLDGAATGGIDVAGAVIVSTGLPGLVSIVGNLVNGASSAAAITGPSGALAIGNLAPEVDCNIVYAATINPHAGQINCHLLAIGAGGAITSVTAGARGRVLTLQALGALSATDGGNLLLNGNWTAGANDTLTLRSDGVNWIEVSRSDN